MTTILPGTGRGTARRQPRGGGASPPAVPPVVERARQLRRIMTLPEALLWRELRGRPNGVKFRRQHPVLGYVVDFYCGDGRFAIEVDGKVHDTEARSAYDRARDETLARSGIAVIRIPAVEILRDPRRVAAAILDRAAPPLHHSPAASGPPPRSGEDQG